MRFQRETIEGVHTEILPLIRKHSDEITRFKDIPLDPDLDHFLQAEKFNLLRLYTARNESDQTLTGYALFYLFYAPHYRSSLEARADLLFIDPEHRGFGLSFLHYCDRELEKDGAEVIYHSVSTKFNYAPLLIRAGYDVHETLYSRRV